MTLSLCIKSNPKQHQKYFKTCSVNQLKYPTNFSTSNHSIPPFKLSKSKYRISIRGPTLRKKIPTNSEKMQESVTVFKNSMRKKLQELQNETSYF